MTQDKSIPLRRHALGLAVCSALAALAAAPAHADPVLTARLFRDTDVLFRDADMSRWSENYVELGLGYNSNDSYRFGGFTGLTDKGGFPIAGFNWLWRDANNDAQYWHVYGSTLGLDSRKLQAEGGVQGRWGASFNFDQIRKSQTDTASFIHDGLGTSNLTLAGGAGVLPGGTITNNTATINPLLKKFGIEQGREVVRLGLNGIAPSNWDWKINYREDRRDGTRLTGLPVNTTFRSMIVPYQIDDRTSVVEAILSYNTKQAQFSLGYNYSQFHNNLSSFTVANPFNAAQALERMSLAPSNDYHQINADGGYNFTKATRLTTKFSYSISRQNEAFLPYSANLAVGAAGNVTPRASLDGKVVKTLFDIALTAKPIDKMNLRLAYQYHNSDNRTPVDNYISISRDRDNAGVLNTNQRRNAPLSTREHTVSIDGDYEIAPKTILRAGLERKSVKYSMKDALYENVADRDYTNTDKLSLELRRPISTEFLGSVGYTHTQRRGSEYDKNSYFRNTYWNPGATTLTNHPSVRPFLYQDFNEDRIRASGNWNVSETVSLQAGADTYRKQAKGTNCGTIVDPVAAAAFVGTLPDACLGRSLADGTNLNLDLQWQPEENLTTFAFASIGETGTKQKGRQGTTSTNQALEWSADLANRDHTLGLGLKWQPEDYEDWDLGGTYVFNNGLGKASITTGTLIAPAQTSMPDNWSRLHTLQLFAKWDYSKQITWRFNYLYENLKSADWAYDNLTNASNASVLLTGQSAPRSNNHVFGISALVKSW
ncbi:MAG: MtrB/PioB family decaheme-associated outer membrane protein [Sulfuritalea sp.]|nr:MtrB/PioB family decaheme-associated outer membrane protein [Sulfuritalea sp.]